MKRDLGAFAVVAPLLVALFTAHAALAQKQGGILKMYTPDSPASMSILEEGTVFAQGPMMGVFNNLVMFDQQVKQNSLQSIVPDLATGWSWNEDGTALTLPLRQGVKWHDGKPFTARDVECTWDLILEKSSDRFRINPYKSWYRNLDRVGTNGDYEVTFHLKRPQPAFPMLLADGHSAIYPCHVSARDMCGHPGSRWRATVITGKPGRPYLDGIEYAIIRDRSTATLAFISGKFDMTFPNDLTVPLQKNIESQMPDALCELAPQGGQNRNLLVNRDKPPFDSPELRRAMALSFDRKAFIDILSDRAGRDRRGAAARTRRDLGDAARPAENTAWL